MKLTLALMTLGLSAFGSLVFFGAEAQDVVVTISRDACARAVGYVPGDDVSYRPGSDVRGREVAPADLYASPQPTPPDLTKFTLRYQPLPDEENLELSNFPLGEITVDELGHAYLNGEPLQGERESWLQAQCREALEG